MAYYCATVSYSSAGIKTITCGFQPVGMRITINYNSGTVHSKGTSDGTRQLCDWFFNDVTDYDGGNHTDRMVSARDMVGGVITEIARANFDSFTATAGKINVVTANVGPTFTVELWS